MFVSVFANGAVDLHNNSISKRNVKTHIFKKIYKLSSKKFNAGNYLQQQKCLG